jgi:hypothetical protein
MRKMVELDGVPPTEIKSALQWYRDYVGGEYVPVIESGAALRSKWGKLQNAIRREARRRPSPHDEPDEGLDLGVEI